MSLSDLVSHLSCLQELDIIGFTLLTISAADCKHFKLSSFSFDYGQLEQVDSPDQSCFQHFVLAESAPAKASKPFLRMDFRFATCDAEVWGLQLPFWALAHLTIHEAPECPGVFVVLNALDLRHLRMLDIHVSAFSDATDRTALLESKLRLTHLCIAGSSCQSYDFAQCTILVSLNITRC